MVGVYVDDVFFYLMSFKHNRIINDEQHNTKNRIYDEYTIHKEFRIIKDEKKIQIHLWLGTKQELFEYFFYYEVIFVDYRLYSTTKKNSLIVEFWMTWQKTDNG